MKNLIIILALMFTIPALANGKPHGHEHHPDIHTPKDQSDGKGPTKASTAPTSRSNTEGSRDVCNRWIKPSYCLEKP